MESWDSNFGVLIRGPGLMLSANSMKKLLYKGLGKFQCVMGEHKCFIICRVLGSNLI